MSEFTAYQQSLVDSSSQPSSFIRKCATIFGVTLLGAGFVYQLNGSAPPYLEGWLILLTSLLIIFNCFTAIFGMLMLTILKIVNFILVSVAEIENPEDQPSDKLKYKSRSFLVSFAKNSKLLGVNHSGFLLVMDVLADCFLFVMLATANHPFMALLHGSSIAVQHFFLHVCKKTVLKSISLIPDPFQSEGVVNIDDLMNKLCQGEDSAQDK